MSTNRRNTRRPSIIIIAEKTESGTSKGGIIERGVQKRETLGRGIR